MQNRTPDHAGSYHLILWTTLILTTILDTILIIAIAQTYGKMTSWWLIQKSQADPLIAFIVIDMLLLRLGVLILGLRHGQRGNFKNITNWLAFVPILGAPILFAGLLAVEHTTET